MKRKRNIKRAIAIRLKRVYAHFPVLWRKKKDVKNGQLSIRGKILIRIAARWSLKNGKSKTYASGIKKLKYDLLSRYPTDAKRILFLVEHVSPRLSKMAKALHDVGYHVTLLHNSLAVDYQENLKDAHKYCDFYCDYYSIPQLLYLIIESRIPIIHYFVNSGHDMSDAILLFQMREILPKIVIERYDIFNGMIIAKRIVYKQERYLMENADGVCCREYSGEFCEKELGFIMRKDTLLFWDYADQALIFEKKDDELSICYVGGLVADEQRPGRPVACFQELAKMCEENKCHFHVYPSVWDKEKLATFIQFEKHHKYFHIHKPVEHSRLYKELGQYDYGIGPIKKSYREKASDGTCTANKYVYAGTNKYFDYISAGIPMIAATPERQTLDFEKKGMILRWTIEEFDFNELRRRKKELQANVLENRGYWMIQNRVHDLTDYYRKVLKED